MNRRGFLGLAFGSVAAIVAKPLKALSAPNPPTAILGERTFRCGSGEMDTIYSYPYIPSECVGVDIWRKVPGIPEYVFVAHEKIKADMMEKSGVPITHPRTNYRVTGFKC